MYVVKIRQHTLLSMHFLTGTSAIYKRGFAMLSLVFMLLFSLSYIAFSSSRSVIAFNKLETLTQKTSSRSFSAKQATRELAKRAAFTPLHNLISMQGTHKFSITQFEYKGMHNLLVEQFSVAALANDGSVVYKESFIKYPSLLALPTTALSFFEDSSVTERLFNRKWDDLNHNYFPNPLYKNSCENLQKRVVIWIEGNCVLTAKNVQHTNKKNPALLIVKNGDITLEKATKFYGVLIIIPSTSHTNKVLVHPSATLTGLAVSTNQIATDVQGNISYSFKVLQNLQQHPALFKIIPIPGTAYAY